MENKEERILITKVSGECRNLRVVGEDTDVCQAGLYCAANPHSEWEKITKRTCKTCKREKFLIGISRQEAIEVMAKGMYLLTNPEDTKYANFYNCYFFELAEAALNALLER